MNRDLLLEIGTEEIPARFMHGILAEIKDNAASMLQESKVGYQEIQVFGTPRRLVLLVKGLAENQDDTVEVNRGPSVAIAFDSDGNPTKAAQGFARGQGINVSELTVQDRYVYAKKTHRGEAVDDILPSFMTDLIHGLQFPKSMRWGNEKMRFVRPIRWLVALLDDKVIPFEIAGVKSDRYSRGHRFLGTENVEIPAVSEYNDIMRKQFVIVDQEERREYIRKELNRIAQENGGKVLHDEDLLEEVVYLVEYPTVLCGGFEDKYLKLPDGAVITPMKDHQRYFPLRDKAGNLLPKFLTVRNGGTDFIDLVRVGNERVLRARLADAEFFFNEDRKRSLEERYEDLQKIVFQEGLGNMQDKTKRLLKVANFFVKEWKLDARETKLLERAIHLAKVDLTTAMVTEFTELQGEMGKEYALLDGEDPAVAEGIGEQYLPSFSGDTLPQTKIGIILGFCDKLDNLVATFSRGLIPTGSQDPFALRRQAIGIIQTTIGNQLHWSLTGALQAAQNALSINDKHLNEAVADFIVQRLRNILLDEGIQYDVVDAVLAQGCPDIYDAYIRAQALQNSGLVRDEELRHALTRVLNIVGDAKVADVSPDLFTTGAEKELYVAYQQVLEKTLAAYAEYDYESVYKIWAQLIAPINRFFEEVIVMAEDPAIRQARLGLVGAIAQMIKSWADLRKLAG